MLCPRAPPDAPLRSEERMSENEGHPDEKRRCRREGRPSDRRDGRVGLQGRRGPMACFRPARNNPAFDGPRPHQAHLLLPRARPAPDGRAWRSHPQSARLNDGFVVDPLTCPFPIPRLVGEPGRPGLLKTGDSPERPLSAIPEAALHTCFREARWTVSRFFNEAGQARGAGKCCFLSKPSRGGGERDRR